MCVCVCVCVKLLVRARQNYLSSGRTDPFVWGKMDTWRALRGEEKNRRLTEGDAGKWKVKDKETREEGGRDGGKRHNTEGSRKEEDNDSMEGKK